MKFFVKVFLCFLVLTAVTQVEASKKTKCDVKEHKVNKGTSTELSNTGSVTSSNSCVTFSVSSGTGCAWMCNYCATQLGTNNYYFTNGVCTYEQGTGCVGNPVAGVQYSCCST